jgi:hypothetical protein
MLSADEYKVFAHQQDTAWVVQDPSTVRCEGHLWDARALQECWPLHGQAPNNPPDAKRIVGV